MFHSKPSQPEEKLVSIVAWVGRALVAALLLYSPWNYGMVTWSQHIWLTYWTLAILLATSALVIVRGRLVTSINFFGLVLVGFVLMTLVQVLPLPSFLYQTFAPSATFEGQVLEHAAQFSTIGEAQLQAAGQSIEPSDSTLSIYPVQTKASLVGLACGVTLFFCSAILFDDKHSRIALLATLILSTTVIGILGIFQSVSWNSWTLLKMPTKSNFATFVNRNTAPQFLSFGIGGAIAMMSIWKRVKDQRRKKRYQRRYPATSTIGRIRHVCEDLILELDIVMFLLLFAIVTIIVAVVAAGSRGGVVALLFSLAVTILFLIASNRRLIIYSLVGLVATLVAAAVFLNLLELDDEISQRMQDLQSSGRLELWSASLGQSVYWITGSGLGTFQFAIMPVNPMSGVWPRHAESIYVEIASEYGLPAAIVALVALMWLAWKLRPSESTKSLDLWPAALFSLVAISIQSMVDFGLIIPAIFLPASALIGAYLHEESSTERDSIKDHWLRRRSTFLAIAGLVLLVFFIGLNPLRGFASAERMAKRFEQSGIQKPEAIGRSELVQDSDLKLLAETVDYSHPEVVLQLARIRLNQLEVKIRGLKDWPSQLPLQEQIMLSSPEFVAAVLRSNSEDPRWRAWQNFYRQHPFVEEELRIYHQSFKFASRSSPLDWRSAWGIFQTTTESSSAVDCLTWSRLDILSGSLFDLQEVTGTCSLISGNRELGIASWKQAVEAKPESAQSLSKLVGTLLPESEVLKVLPDQPIAVAGFAKSLASTSPKTSIELLNTLDVVRLHSLAHSSADWELAFWVAESLEDQDSQVLALKKIAGLLPFDVGIRVRLAKILEKQGDIGEAIRQLEQAARRSSLSTEDQNYLQALKDSRQPPSSRTPPQ